MFYGALLGVLYSKARISKRLDMFYGVKSFWHYGYYGVMSFWHYGYSETNNF